MQQPMFSKGDIVRIKWIPLYELDRIASQHSIKRHLVDEAIRKAFGTVVLANDKSTYSTNRSHWGDVNKDICIDLEINLGKYRLYLPKNCLEAVFTV